MVHWVYIKCGFILPIVVFGVDPMFFNSSGDFVVYFSCLLVDEWSAKLWLRSCLGTEAGVIEEGSKVMVQSCLLDGISILDPGTMAAFVHGCVFSGSFGHVREFHGLLHWMWLLSNHQYWELSHGYVCKERAGCFRTFDLPKNGEQRYNISWSAMISCLAKNDRASEAWGHLAELLWGNLSNGTLYWCHVVPYCRFQPNAPVLSLNFSQVGMAMILYKILN